MIICRLALVPLFLAVLHIRNQITRAWFAPMQYYIFE